MGTDFALTMYAVDRAKAESAAKLAYARIAAVDSACSDYKDDSAVRRLCETAKPGQWTVLEPDLAAVLGHATRLAADTEGAFDVTLGPYVLLWRQARHRRSLPQERHLEMAAERVGWKKLQVDSLRGTGRLMVGDMHIDLGGIAKGYAVDAALAELRQAGVGRALVNGGGDVAAGRAPPGRKGWRVQLSPLPGIEGLPTLVLENAAVATSGDLKQFVEIDGVRYSHILDPRTGIGVTGQSQVSIIAANCTEADALASAVSVLGLEKGIAMIEKRDKTEAYIVQKGRTSVVTSQTGRFESYLSNPSH